MKNGLKARWVGTKGSRGTWRDGGGGEMGDGDVWVSERRRREGEQKHDWSAVFFLFFFFYLFLFYFIFIFFTAQIGGRPNVGIGK